MVKSAADAENKVLAEHLDLVMTAVHEAGHVICGLLHGFRIDAVHVFNHPKHHRIEGLTFYDDKPRPNQKWLHSEFCISYAGLVAEQILFGLLYGTEELPMVLKSGSSDDIYSAGRLMRKYKVGTPGKGRARLKKKIIQETTRQLTKHWKEVIIIAHALIQKRHLYFSDLRTLLLQKSKNKTLWKKHFKKIK
jgi:hypothetical protein